MKFTDLLSRIFDKIVVIIVSVVLGAVLLGNIVETNVAATYYSVAKLYLVSSDEGMFSMTDLQAAEYLKNDYLAVFQTRELHQKVADEIELDYTIEQLSDMVSANSIDETHLISITVRAESPEHAELLADTYAEVASDFIFEKLNAPKPIIFENAVPAVRIDTLGSQNNNYILGAVAGFFISCIFIIMFSVFDNRVWTPEDVQETIHAETIGIVMAQKKAHPVRRQKK